MESFPNVPAMLGALSPTEPVYCIHPSLYRDAAREFIEKFPGRVLYAVKADNDTKTLDGERHSFRVFGPTCDASDCLPEALELPSDIDVGDYIEFESIGAYSLSGRTDFNGFGDHTIVRIDP